MKRAEAEIISTSFFQFHKAANDIDDIDAVENLLYCGLGDQGEKNNFYLLASY